MDMENAQNTISLGHLLILLAIIERLKECTRAIEISACSLQGVVQKWSKLRFNVQILQIMSCMSFSEG